VDPLVSPPPAPPGHPAANNTTPTASRIAPP
jgi:hypothetical protein